MIKVEAVKFGSAVNAGGKEYTFIKSEDPYVTPWFDVDRQVIVLVDRKEIQTIVFPTNVQWARLNKEADESKPSTGGSRGKGTGKTP